MKKQTFKNISVAFLFIAITVVMLFGNLKTKRGGVMEDAIQNKQDPYYLMNKKAQKKFQGTEAFIIILRFPDGIQSKTDILKIKNYQKYLTQKLKDATVVGLNNLNSFTNYQNNIYPINFTDTENILLQDQDYYFDIEKWKSEIAKQKSLAKFFVDEDFQHVNFIVYPNQGYDEIEVFRNTVETLEERDVAEWEWFIKKDIEPKNENILVAGWIQGRGLMDGALNADVILGISIGVFFSFLIFLWFTRSFLQSFIASTFVIGLSVFWVRGEIGLLSLLPFDFEIFDIKERVFVLMAYTNCVVQGVSFALHMFESFNEVDENCPVIGVDKKWRLVRREVLESIMITAFIAFTGFITLLNFNVKAIQELGILSALGVVNLVLLSTILVPALHSIFYRPKNNLKKEVQEIGKPKKSFLLSFLNKINYWLVFHWVGKIFIVSILIILGGFVYLGFKQDKLIVGSNALEYLQGTIIDRSNDYLSEEENLGFTNFEFIVTAKNKNIKVFENSDFTKETWKFSKKIEKIEGVRSVNSILNTVEQTANLTGDNFVNNDRELKYIFNNLENNLDKKIIDQFYNNENYRFTVTTAEGNSKEWGKIFEDILKTSEQFDEIDEILFFGDAALYHRVDDYVIQGKTWNVVTSQAVVIAICVFWIFISLRKVKNKFRQFTISIKSGIIMSLPLLFATECILLVMMFLKVPLDISTAMIGVTAIAASIDFSIYFVAEYKKALINKEKNSLKVAIDKQGKIILMDMFLNQLFFLPLIFSSFIPVQRLGWMLVIMLFFAAIGSLIIMPPMLVWSFKKLN
ncbi:MAG: hypothetical protein KAT32_02430 [Candidatus Moranbacteria bacterium]|nr:hypothetical protein [Candidatus Moranbacteria bacterium]